MPASILGVVHTAPAFAARARACDDGRALNRLAGWAGDGARLAKILVDNPARLYGF